MKVVLYGRLAEEIGAELEVSVLPGSSVADVREMIAAKHPNVAGVLLSRRALSVVGEWMVRDDYRLAANDTLLTIGLRTRPAQLAVVDTHKFSVTLVNLTAVSELSVAGHQWTSPGGRYTFVTWEGGTGSNQGIAVVDHEAGNQVVRTMSYPGRPHGIDRAP